MSVIRFHTKDDEALVRGSERAHMAILTKDIALSALGSSSMYDDWLLPMIPESSWVHSSEPGRLNDSVRLYLDGYHSTIIVDGQDVNCWELNLNTAWTIGNDVIKLMTRIHGQCEVHCYIEGPNRAWIASIIRHGRELNILRPDQGWEETVQFLEQSDDEPVVCSYSACQSFPNLDMLPDDHPIWQIEEGEDEDGEDNHLAAFYELSHEEAWDACMKGVRECGGGLELDPDNWGTGFYYANGMNWFDIQAR